MKVPLANAVLGLTILGVVLLFLHAFLHMSIHFESAALSGAAQSLGHSNNMQQLLELIRAQNNTIAALSMLIESSKRDTSAMAFAESLRKKDAQIRDLKAKQGKDTLAGKCPVCSSSSSSGSSNCNVTTSAIAQQSQHSPLLKGIDGACEKAYGMMLVDEWRTHAQTWCQSDATSGFPESKLVCYPYHQMHKQRDGRGPDLFCQATNFLIDFSKVQGSHPASGKPPLGQQYYNFKPGSLSSPCKATPYYRHNLFMPHHGQQMETFEQSKIPRAGTFTIEETATYLLARDEDCENSFHSTADFVSPTPASRSHISSGLRCRVLIVSLACAPHNPDEHVSRPLCAAAVTQGMTSHVTFSMLVKYRIHRNDKS